MNFYIMLQGQVRRVRASPIMSRIVKGSIWSVFGAVASRATILIAMILVARLLGKVEFGMLGLVQSTLGVFGLMAGAGLGGAATRFVAAYAVDNPEKAGEVIGLIRVSSLVTVLLASCILAACSGFLAELAFEDRTLKPVYLLGALLMAVTAFRGIQNGVLAGLERFENIAKLNIFEGVVGAIALVGLCRFWGLRGAILGLATGGIVALIAGQWKLKSVLHQKKINVSFSFAQANWGILSGYSAPSFLAQCVGTPVMWIAMTYLARQENGVAQLGLYNAAYQWQGPLIFIPIMLTNVSVPIMVQEWQSGRRAKFLHIYKSITRFALVVTGVAMVPLCIFSPWIMSAYGSDFREGWLILALLSCAALFHANSKISAAALFGMNQAWTVLQVNLVWSGVMLLLSFPLSERYGALGLSVAFVIAYASLSFTSAAMVARRSS